MDNFTPSGPKYSAAVEEPVGERARSVPGRPRPRPVPNEVLKAVPLTWRRLLVSACYTPRPKRAKGWEALLSFQLSYTCPKKARTTKARRGPGTPRRCGRVAAVPATASALVAGLALTAAPGGAAVTSSSPRTGPSRPERTA